MDFENERPMEKKVVITLSRVFQGNHSRKGEPTKFKENLAAGNKKHTIRENYALWKHNLDKVTNGNFVLSIRQWTGRPYNSPQCEIKRCKDGVGYQQITMRYDRKRDFVTAKVGNHYVDVAELAKNDCLSLDDFKEWFFGKGENGNDFFKGIVNHFTPFRY